MSNWRSADRWLPLRVAPLLIAAAVLAGCGGADEAQDHSAHGGMPGMDMSTPTNTLRPDTALDAALRSPNTFVVADLQTVTMQQRYLPVEVKASGVIAYDPRNVQAVTARAAGWIDKLHVKYRYQPVQQGQPLMEIYSRELVTEQENYLFLVRQEPEDPVMVAAAARRLSLLGLSQSMITGLRRTGSVKRTVTYFSPATGHLHENDREQAMAPVGSMSAPGGGVEGLSLREGAYVEKGRTLFTIYGTSSVIALLNVHPADGQERIAVGQQVTVHFDGDTAGQLEGRVDLVEPVYREGASVVSVRVYLMDPGGALRIGSRVSVVIAGAPKNAWSVPVAAVVSTGLRQYVFVKESGGFQARMVSTGRRSGEWVELRSGIIPQEPIAANAQLLIDSDSFLKATAP
jgi:Cu(I)/Ag(I) efflux system membrane fusion protein